MLHVERSWILMSWFACVMTSITFRRLCDNYLPTDYCRDFFCTRTCHYKPPATKRYKLRAASTDVQLALAVTAVSHGCCGSVCGRGFLPVAKYFNFTASLSPADIAFLYSWYLGTWCRALLEPMAHHNPQDSYDKSFDKPLDHFLVCRWEALPNSQNAVCD